METTTQPSTTDRIQKKVLLRAPRSRVWRAISDAKQFGSWFGMKVEGAFNPNTTVKGTITPTTVDDDVASKQKDFDGMPFELYIDRVEPERLFSFKWHPFAIEKDVDYSKEPTTLVSFELEEVTDGVMLTVTESGFDRIPLARRAKAFAANDGGWTLQMKLIEKYLAKAS
jgi:uncharacterized protein YndB with AHSA1/START domain